LRKTRQKNLLANSPAPPPNDNIHETQTRQPHGVGFWNGGDVVAGQSHEHPNPARSAANLGDFEYSRSPELGRWAFPVKTRATTASAQTGGTWAEFSLRETRLRPSALSGEDPSGTV
jgi:hypothetical protein